MVSISGLWSLGAAQLLQKLGRLEIRTMSEIKRPSETLPSMPTREEYVKWSLEWRDRALRTERLAVELCDALDKYIEMADETTLDELYDGVVWRHKALRAGLPKEAK